MYKQTSNEVKKDDTGTHARGCGNEEWDGS